VKRDTKFIQLNIIISNIGKSGITTLEWNFHLEPTEFFW